MIDFDTFQKMSKNVEVLGKLMVDNAFKKLPKVQLMAQSGHTGAEDAFRKKSISKFLCQRRNKFEMIFIISNLRK